MFEENPCRLNPFTVFKVDRSDTGLRIIHDRVKTAVDDKASGHSITMADQTHITLNGVTPHNIKPH